MANIRGLLSKLGLVAVILGVFALLKMTVLGSSHKLRRKRDTSAGLAFVMIWPTENDLPRCDLQTLWSRQVLCEIDYFKRILDPIGITIKQRTVHSVPHKVDILGYSSNHTSARKIQQIVNEVHPRLLVHTSDEHGKRPEHNEITGVDTILRQYHWDHYPQKSNIYQIPIGEHCWDTGMHPLVPIRDRKYIFSFIGNPKGARNLQLDALKSRFAAGTYFAGATEPAENKYIYSQSKFVFCPKGNTVFECGRNYNAMKNGCIPVVSMDKNAFEEQFGHMLGGPPPFVHKPTFEEIIIEMKALLEDEIALEEKSKEQMQWIHENDRIVREFFKAAVAPRTNSG